MPPVTASQIARQLGVSRQSVSKVLVGGKTNIRVSDELATRIRRTADRLGYRPSPAARTITTGRTNSIDMLMSTGSGASRLPTPLIEGIHDALIARDMQLTVSRLPDHKLRDAEYVPKILRQHSADGILVNYTHTFPEEMPELIRRHRLPAVWLNIKRDANCVYPDEVDAFRRATGHLLELGHRRISFGILNAAGHFSDKDREAGYTEAMRGAGLEPHVLHARAAMPHEYTETGRADDRHERVRSWLRGPDRPTAVLAASHREADFVAYAAATLGLRLGRDLSLVGVGDSTDNRMGVPLTQVVLPLAEMGRRAVELLMQRVDDPETSHAPLALRSELHLADSCGPPPA